MPCLPGCRDLRADNAMVGGRLIGPTLHRGGAWPSQALSHDVQRQHRRHGGQPYHLQRRRDQRPAPSAPAASRSAAALSSAAASSIPASFPAASGSIATAGSWRAAPPPPRWEHDNVRRRHQQCRHDIRGLHGVVISSVSAFALVASMHGRAQSSPLRRSNDVDDWKTSEMRPVTTNHGFLS